MLFMKQQDLRVGNWIKHKDNIKDAQCILGIDGDQFKPLYNNIDGKWFPLSWCEGIKITDSLLEKTGWIYDQDNYYGCWAFILDLTGDAFVDKFVMFKEQKEDKHYYKITFQGYWYKIEFVHELQNILGLLFEKEQWKLNEMVLWYSYQ